MLEIKMNKKQYLRELDKTLYIWDEELEEYICKFREYDIEYEIEDGFIFVDDVSHALEIKI